MLMRSAYVSASCVKDFKSHRNTHNFGRKSKALKKAYEEACRIIDLKINSRKSKGSAGAESTGKRSL